MRVTSSLATPPCQYGCWITSERRVVSCTAPGRWIWSGGPAPHHVTDENLLSFDTYSPPTLNKIFYNQAYDAMKDSKEGRRKRRPVREADAFGKTADVPGLCGHQRRLLRGKAVDIGGSEGAPGLQDVAEYYPPFCLNIWSTLWRTR